MQVTGEVILKGSREQVWALLNDETVLAKCTPGCERLTRTGPDEYAVAIKVGLAAIKGSYEGKLQVTDKVEPASMTLKIETNGSGGFANIGGRMDFVEQVGGTKIVYNWDVSVGGPVAMVGQRVLGGVAKWLIGEFFNTAQKELNARTA